MSDSSKKRTVIVGIFVFFGLGFLIVGILAIGNLHETFKTKINVMVLFDEVSGLQKGNNIWFSGVKIGVVGKVDFFSQKKVLVEMNIDETVTQYIRKDALVKISTDGLIGNKICLSATLPVMTFIWPSGRWQLRRVDQTPFPHGTFG
jgi:phospholipid/cholesterol/gamma-HCH transport system substrate-binding protein